MAGDWIKMRCNLHESPEVFTLADKLGLDEDAVVGKLHRAWAWADQHTPDGWAAGVSAGWLDRYVRCPGFADAMASAAVKWLVVESGGLRFPNFERHNGSSAKLRADAQQRKRLSRDRTTDAPEKAQPALSSAVVTASKTVERDDVTENCDRHTGGGHSSVTTLSQKPVTNVTTSCDKSVTREEKRRVREENTHTPLPPKGGEDGSEDGGAEVSASDDPPGFAAFWAEFPRRRRKERAKCRRKWDRGNLEPRAEIVLACLRAYAASFDWTKENGQYAPAPERFLNGKAWDDDPADWPDAAGATDDFGTDPDSPAIASLKAMFPNPTAAEGVTP